MDVDHPAGVVGRDLEQVEVATESDKVDLLTAAGCEGTLTDGSDIAVTRVEHNGGDARSTRDGRTADILTAGNDQHDISGKPPITDPFEQVVERTAATRDENRQPKSLRPCHHDTAFEPSSAGRTMMVSGCPSNSSSS